MKKQSEMDAFHGRKEETPDASNAEVSSVSEDGAGGGTRTHTMSPPTDFEWLYRFCFPQQSALHRSQKALILLAFLTFSCFY